MKNSIKKLIFVLVLMAMIATLAFALAACNNDAQTQTTPPTAEDAPSTGGDTPSTGGDTTHVHAYGSWSVTRSATCSVEGLKTRRCSKCGNVETETIPKTAHTPVIDAAVEATCTQEGKTQGSHCGVCGTVIVAQTKVDKKEHTVVIDQAIPATCTEPGKTQGSHCDVCKTVLQEQQETRALGHTAGAEWYSNDDTHWHECIRCHTHMEETAHTYGMWETQSTPTIDAEGIDRQYCTCGKYHERKVDKLPPFTFVMDGTVYSVKAYLGHDSVVEVPSTYNGVTVAVIGANAFQYQTGITDIILPETILKIDYGAFSYCTSLQNVNIPKCMTFEDLVFDNCTALKEIVMPDNLTSCGKNMFNNCTALTKVTFTGGNVTGVLSYNDTVQEIIVEDGVRSVSKYAFIGCTSLKYLTLPRIESSATSFVEYYLGVTPQIYTYYYNGTDAYTNRDLIEPEAVDIYSMNGRVFGIPRSGCNWYVNSRKLGTVTNGGITYTYTDKPIKVSKWYNWYDISVDRYYNIPQTWSAEYSYLPDTPIEKLTVTNQMISRYDSVFDNCTCKLDIWQKFPIKQLSVTGNSSPFVDEFNEEYYTLIVEHTDNYIEKFPLFDYVDEDDRATAGELGQHQLTVTYQDASIDYALEILLHQFDDAVFNSHEFIFDGETKYMSADMLTGLPEGTDIVFDGDGQSELGHYEVTATLSKQYYESKTLTATMDIFPPTFSLTYVLGIDEATHENPSDYQTNGDGVELAAATLAGFGFVDWYTEPEFTNKITKIEGNAHQDYTLYAKWQLPFDMTSGSIKVNAFGKKQTEIVIPNRVYDQTITAIASEAFEGCTSLRAVTIGEGVQSIGDWAFYGCTGLQTVTIGEGVRSISDYAFHGCTGITKVNYLGTLKGWCEIEFNYSANPLSVTDGKAELYCNGDLVDLFNLNIPVGTTKIGSYAFYKLTDITSVTIPDSVQSIGEYAFSYCTGLQTVTIGEGVTSIGENAFYGCKGISKVNYLGDLKGWCEIEFNYSANPLSVTDGKAELYCNGDLVDLFNLNIPVGTTKIGSYAFRGLKGITSVTIPDSVTSIGSSAFSGCTGLQTVTIGEGVTSIGENAFDGCKGISKVNYLGDLKGWCEIEFNYSANPLSVTDGKAELYCNGDLVDLFNLNIPVGTTKIGSYAFRGLKGITSVTIPDSVTSIGSSAFSGCTGLQTVTIGEGVTSIGNSAFYGCTGLQSVTIGENVQSIGDYAFHDCTGLKDIYYAGGETQWGNIKKGELWNQYGVYNKKTGRYVYYKIDYRMHYNSTGPASASAASNISALPSDQPVFIACDKLDLWVKQD